MFSLNRTERSKSIHVRQLAILQPSVPSRNVTILLHNCRFNDNSTDFMVLRLCPYIFNLDSLAIRYREQINTFTYQKTFVFNAVFPFLISNNEEGNYILDK